MHDPATTEIWKTAFGKDFGGMAQGNIKMGHRKEQTQFLLCRTQKSLTFQKIKPLLTPVLSSTTIPKKRTHTEFESQRAGI
jgi:hypothetical protein